MGFDAYIAVSMKIQDRPDRADVQKAIRAALEAPYPAPNLVLQDTLEGDGYVSLDYQGSNTEPSDLEEALKAVTAQFQATAEMSYKGGYDEEEECSIYVGPDAARLYTKDAIAQIEEAVQTIKRLQAEAQANGKRLSWISAMGSSSLDSYPLGQLIDRYQPKRV